VAPIDQPRDGAQRWRALALVAIVDISAMGLWFTASYSVPAIRAEWHLNALGTGSLTGAVQLGFVAGALAGALLNWPDRYAPGRLIGIAAMVAALSNLAFAVFAHDPLVGLPLRFLTGAALASVYPPSMKLASSWFRSSDRGLAVGAVIAALTLGSASPLLIGLLPLPWRPVVLASSVLGGAGALIAFRLRSGPYAAPCCSQFDLRASARVFTNRGTLLASLGYYGHMWELYAFWGWLPAFLTAGALATLPASSTRLTAFVAIGAFGAIGCLAGGLVADRLGRSVTTDSAMLLSGLIALASPLVFGAPALLAAAVVSVWGATVIADSGQFSAAMSELAERAYVGTALTLQVCVGFFVSTLTVQTVPLVAAQLGWRWAFCFLALGPALGSVAMVLLWRRPEALKMAGGRR
jgi:MFS family permease